MAQYELTGEAPPPMSVKRPAWGVYDIFDTAGGGRLFVGVVTDTQWEIFCREFERRNPSRKDARLKTNGMRVKERSWLMPRVNRDHQEALPGGAGGQAGGDRHAVRADRQALGPARRSAPEGIGRAARDPRFEGKTAHVPALPIELDGKRLAKRSDPPQIGQHGKELLAGLGCSPGEIDQLQRQRIVAFPTNNQRRGNR